MNVPLEKSLQPKVIYIVKTENKAAKNLIRKPLKRLCRVPQPKGHADKLIEAKGGDYSSQSWVRRQVQPGCGGTLLWGLFY